MFLGYEVLYCMSLGFGLRIYRHANKYTALYPLSRFRTILAHISILSKSVNTPQ